METTVITTRTPTTARRAERPQQKRSEPRGGPERKQHRDPVRPERGLLMTFREIQEELGVTRATADAIMRQLGKARFRGGRRVYVHRQAVYRLVEESTVL